jgi:hypothetical protein
MARTKTKSGSKVMTNCPICGKAFTRAGVIGHMRFKHGKDYKSPLFNVEKPMSVVEARRKAHSYDVLTELFKKYSRYNKLVDRLEALAEKSPSHDKLVSQIDNEIQKFASKTHEPVSEVEQAVIRVKTTRDNPPLLSPEIVSSFKSSTEGRRLVSRSVLKARQRQE